MTQGSGRLYDSLTLQSQVSSNSPSNYFQTSTEARIRGGWGLGDSTAAEFLLNVGAHLKVGERHVTRQVLTWHSLCHEQVCSGVAWHTMK